MAVGHRPVYPRGVLLERLKLMNPPRLPPAKGGGSDARHLLGATTPKIGAKPVRQASPYQIAQTYDMFRLCDLSDAVLRRT